MDDGLTMKATCQRTLCDAGRYMSQGTTGTRAGEGTKASGKTLPKPKIPAPRPTGTPVASFVTPATKTRAPSRPAHPAASSTPDASGLGVFGAGKAPVPVPLGDAAPREKSRFTFAAERDD